MAEIIGSSVLGSEEQILFLAMKKYQKENIGECKTLLKTLFFKNKILHRNSWCIRPIAFIYLCNKGELVRWLDLLQSFNWNRWRYFFSQTGHWKRLQNQVA